MYHLGGTGDFCGAASLRICSICDVIYLPGCCLRTAETALFSAWRELRVLLQRINQTLQSDRVTRENEAALIPGFEGSLAGVRVHPWPGYFLLM